MWWAEKIYQVWSRSYSFVMAIQWPWQIRREQDEVVDATPVAPKRVDRRQSAINARDDCYMPIDVLAERLKKIISCKVLCDKVH